MELDYEDIPADHEVQPLRTREDRDNAKVVATCGTCGLSWDDGLSTGLTPTPSARCPFEYFHEDDPRADLPWDEAQDDNPPHMTRNANGSWHCHDCQMIIILFDDDKHYCEAKVDHSGKPSPAELCERFTDLVNGTNDHGGMSAGEIVHDIIADVLDSVRLSLASEGIDGEVHDSIIATVTDYVGNHYGEL